MRLTILSVGRLKRGAESGLFGEYSRRIDGAGKPIGAGPLKVTEVAQSRKGSAAERRRQEGQALIAKLGAGARLIVMDQGGKALSSAGFADYLAAMRDSGTGELAFVLGGPDGIGDEVVRAAEARLSLGPMTLPHGLARIVLAEQIYRALTILAGHPYHRA